MVSNLGACQDHTGLLGTGQASLGLTALAPQPELPPGREDKDPLAEGLERGAGSGTPAPQSSFLQKPCDLGHITFLSL